MTVARDIYLYNSAVNSGVAVWCIGATWTYGWSNMTAADPAQGKFDIVKVRQGGWENPIITLSGTIDVDDIQSNEISETLLKTLVS